MRRFISFLKKFVTITVPFLIVLFLFCEFLLFRWVLPAAQWPYRSTIKGSGDVVRYVYKDSGMYREGRFLQGFPNEIDGYYRINKEGWNSHREYYQQRSVSTRIAVIGDSFVDAHQVTVHQCFATIVEKILVSKGYEVEVYRFGFGAAPLSQYLHMMRYVEKKFDPDIFVVNILGNDFLDSVYGFSNWNGDFLQLRLEDGRWTEVQPKPYIPSRMRMFLKKSATFRYVYQNLSMKSGLGSAADLLKNRRSYDVYQMNVEVENMRRNADRIRSLARYVFEQFQHQLGDRDRLLLVMDGDRSGIYAGKDLSQQQTSGFMSAVAEDARKMNIPVLELGPIFLDDYKKHRKHFEFPHDYHWNARGHALVGKHIADFIHQNKWCSERNHQ